MTDLLFYLLIVDADMLCVYEVVLSEMTFNDRYRSSCSLAGASERPFAK